VRAAGLHAHSAWFVISEWGVCQAHRLGCQTRMKWSLFRCSVVTGVVCLQESGRFSQGETLLHGLLA